MKRRSPLRLLVAAALAAAVLAPPSGFVGPATAAAPKSTGLPLPRFVSLKAGRVNVRLGPSNGHSVKWIFVRAGLPVEIVQEFENWRRIRDSAGEEGWVYGSLLSGRRTALVAPWAGAEPVTVRASASDEARGIAVLSPGVVTGIDKCDGTWCHVEGKGYEGYAQQDRLWGVYPGELVD